LVQPRQAMTLPKPRVGSCGQVATAEAEATVLVVDKLDHGEEMRLAGSRGSVRKWSSDRVGMQRWVAGRWCGGRTDACRVCTSRAEVAVLRLSVDARGERL
jgi:hypothetical protein